MASRVYVHLPGGHLKLTQLCNVWEQRHSGGPNFNIRDKGPGHVWRQKLTHVLPPQTVRMASPDKRSVGGSTELFFYADRPLRFICSSQYPHSKPPVSTCFKTPNNKRKRHFSKCILRASRLILSASLMDTTRLDEFDGHLILLSLHNTTRNRYRAGLRCKRDKRSYWSCWLDIRKNISKASPTVLNRLCLSARAGWPNR